MKKLILFILLLVGPIYGQDITVETLTTTDDITVGDDLTVTDDIAVSGSGQLDGTLLLPSAAPVVLGTNGADTTIAFPDGATATYDASEAEWVLSGDLNITGNVSVEGTIQGDAQLEFTSLAQMLAFDFSQIADGTRVKCNGYWVANDEAFGPDVFWSENSLWAEDGLLVFDPVGAGTGRLVRSFDGPINVKWAGARGAGEARTGTITSTGTAVVGVGTLFTSELAVNDYIRTENANGGYVAKVSAITDDTNLTLSTAFPANVSAISYSEVWDAHPYIQEALDQGQLVYIPTGVFHTSDELVLIHGTKIRGDGNYSAVASTHQTDGNSTIKYIGTGGTDSVVIRASDEPVGTDPSVVDDRDLQNTGITNLVIDGNGLAEIGLYMIRAGSNNDYSYITVMRTKEHGFYVAKSWNATHLNWMAYKNEKNGITIGKDIWNWGSATVDQSTFVSIMGYFNGYDDINDVYFNNFDDTEDSVATDGAITSGDNTLTSASNPFVAGDIGKWLRIAGAGEPGEDLITTVAFFTSAGSVELTNGALTTVSGADIDFIDIDTLEVDYGVGYWGGRGNHFSNAQANENGGAGIYLSPELSPTTFTAGYVENNGASSGASNDWDIYFFGDSDSGSWDITFDSMYHGGGGAFKLSGREPSRIEQGVVFNRMGILTEIDADWGNYRLIDSNRNVTLSGVQPDDFVQSINGNLNIIPIGVSYFVVDRITDAAITSSDNTLTSASNPFVGADTGQSILIEGAGVAGADLLTTIASYTSAGEVEVTDAASTTVSGETSAWVSATFKEGAITDIQYAAVGTYTITMSDDFTSTGYPMLVTTDDNRIVGVTNRLAGPPQTLDIMHRSNSGTLIDSNAKITAVLFGRYE